MYTVIINKKFIRCTFVSSILFCWSLMFPIAVIQRTSASTSFFIWKSKTKLTFPLKCIHFYNGAKVTNNCILSIYISSFYMENNKAQNTIQEKRIEYILFFLQIGWNSTKLCAHVSSTLANKNQRRSTKVHAHKPFLFPSLETL